MNKFEKQLEKWNHGVLRGAQAKLAKVLGVSTATTALWATGKRHPSKGYVAQMAALFGLDVYGVLKLFDPRPVLYLDPPVFPQVTALRDKDDYPYLSPVATGRDFTQGNSVKLPFLQTPPAEFDDYDPACVLEWWSIPRRYAQGALYLVRAKDAGLADAQDDDDLCFVKPSHAKATGTVLLLLQADGHCRCVKLQRKAGAVHFIDPISRQPMPLHDGKIIGHITRRIRSL